MTLVYSTSHDMVKDLVQDISEYNDIQNKVLGIEISFGSKNFGTITHFKQTYTGYETTISAITDKDYEFDLDDLLSFIWRINMKNAGKEIVYPDGTDYSKRKFGSQRKARTSAITGLSQIHPSHYIK